MISLQFSYINIFLSFRGYIQFHSNSSEIWERKKERKRESLLWKIGVLQIHWIFDVTLTWFQNVYFWRNLRDKIWKSLHFRLPYTLQHRMDILSVCSHFWMQELMWLPKMWDERERWKIESESEWIRRREGETMRLTGECVLEEEWMTDICISFGMWNHWTFQYTFKQNDVCPHCLAFLLIFLHFLQVNLYLFHLYILLWFCIHMFFVCE